MQNIFSHLTPEEINTLVSTPTYIGILIAAADTEVSAKETEWLSKVLHFRKTTAHHSLREYYSKAYEFSVEFKNAIIAKLPENQEERMKWLSEQISKANPIIAKLSENVQIRLIDGFKALALSIAEIDGGIFNFFSNHPEEMKWLGLPMLVEQA